MHLTKKNGKMRKKKILLLPKLRDRKGDISKKWYVELSMRNPDTDEMIRKRYECYDDININAFTVPAERYQLAEKIITELKAKIKAGWTIFNDIAECVYEDQIQYSHAARIYNQTVKSTHNYTYWISRFITEDFPGRNLRIGTLNTYKSRYRVFGNWLKSKQLDHANLKQITNVVIIDFFTFLKGDSNLTKRTYRSYSQLLSTFFDFVKYSAGIMENPVYNIPKNKTVKDMGAERIYREDLEKLMTLLDKEDPQLALACRFEYYCGLRPGYEMRLLRISDLDLRRGISKVHVDYGTAKTSRTRYVVIPNAFLDYLIDVWQLDKSPKEHYIFGKKGMPGNECVGKNSLRFRFNKYRDILKLPYEYKLYSMKHTGAVVLAEQGEKLINIRDHLGHTNIATTEHYLRRHGFNESKLIRSNFPEI